jgi:hypothetical protein
VSHSGSMWMRWAWRVLGEAVAWAVFGGAMLLLIGGALVGAGWVIRLVVMIFAA